MVLFFARRYFRLAVHVATVVLLLVLLGAVLMLVLELLLLLTVRLAVLVPSRKDDGEARLVEGDGGGSGEVEQEVAAEEQAEEEVVSKSEDEVISVGEIASASASSQLRVLSPCVEVAVGVLDSLYIETEVSK